MIYGSPGQPIKSCQGKRLFITSNDELEMDELIRDEERANCVGKSRTKRHFQFTSIMSKCGRRVDS